MLKVNTYAPAWLCRPSPGADLFTSASTKGSAQDLQNGKERVTTSASTRTIAQRGNEVFVVIDNEIRWSNLARLKDQWVSHQQRKGFAGQSKEAESDVEIPSYRVG